MGEERAGEGEGAEGVDADGVEEEVVAITFMSGNRNDIHSVGTYVISSNVDMSMYPALLTRTSMGPYLSQSSWACFLISSSGDAMSNS